MSTLDVASELRAWPGESVHVSYDRAADAFVIVAIASTVLGPAMGGTRMKVYASFADALADAMRLAAAMTRKQAMANLPYGGGKAVLAVPAIPERGGDEWRGLFERYGDMVAALGGTYVTAADIYTSIAEMDVIAERTPHVLGRSAAKGGSGDPGRGTARGVFHGIRAACARAFGDPDLAERTVAVQGAGSVGWHLLELLRDAGAATVVADIDPDRARSACEATGARVVGADEIVSTPCDVFAPCATGGVLSAETIPHLRCRVVAGAANNQLATDDDDERLADRGILYAPDYVVNAGGVIHLAGHETLGWDDATVTARLAAIEHTLAEVFDLAEHEGITTAEAADHVADARIEAAAAAR
ncbi:MAG TPA: Glu/Leu/Phe/Val dehydrogenase dimerization domain-containing protein [Actinomycetota bacterium]|nr:Glu/Leu/Phe/Val dehydrogenase dimerization domain-containing protein [Actinomycetota bacterium]